MSNIVLSDFGAEHFEETDRNQMRAVATHDVIFTPAGQTTFNECRCANDVGIYGRVARSSVLGRANL